MTLSAVNPIDSALLGALSAAVYVTDAEARITYYNDAAADLWGMQPEIGSAMWCGSWRLFTADGSPLPHDACPMAVTLRTGEPVRGVEAIVERPDGTRVRVMPFPTPLRDQAGKLVGALNLVMDITQLHEAQAGSQRLAAIVASSDDAIVSKTLDGRVTSWNASATRIFGYDETEMIGENILRIIPPELHDEEKQVLARLRNGERIDHYETVRVAKDGHRIDISLTVSPLREKSGRIVGASKVARDISERKQTEKTQQLLMGELSHRVKNTLATVQAIATQSLRRSRDPADFVSSFTGRVVSLAKAHDLLSEAHWEGVELASLIRDQVLLGVGDERVQWSGPGLTLDAQPALHLAMVLHELGTNARKYGALSVPGGRLSVEWQVVQKSEARELEIRWQENSGRPIAAPEETGFGTTLIEQSLLAHGGSVDIEYSAQGLACMLRLPLAHLKQRTGAYGMPRLGLPEKSGLESLAGRHILIVEDEPLIAMDIEMTLADAGCVVIGPAGDADEAARLIAEGGCDAAFLDANLAGKRVDALAATLTRAGIPFAFVTGYGIEALPPSFRDALVVAKPFGKTKLLSTLAQLFERQMDPAVGHIGANRSTG